MFVEEPQTEFSEEEINQHEDESPSPLLKEGEPVPTSSPQQTITLTKKQADTIEAVTTVSQAEGTKSSYTEAHLTDPTQTPDGTPVEVTVSEVTYPEEQTSNELAYVPGFGWVPLPEPCEVIFAEDMYMNGNKVGTMGG